MEKQPLTKSERRKKRDELFAEYSKKFEIERTFDDLSEIDKELLRLQLETPAISITELARQAKVSYVTAHAHLKNLDYKRILAEFQDEALNILLNGRVKAAIRLMSVIEHGKDCDAVQASKILLYGTGTIVDKRFSNISIKNDKRTVNLVISSDYMPDIKVEDEPEKSEDAESDIIPEIEVLTSEN